MLDLSGYQLTFDDEFNSINISQGASTVWSDIRAGWRLSPYADIGFGDSAFVDPASGINPFSLQNGALDITAVPAGPAIVGPGQWASGLITTQYTFSQEYGYFEIRAMLPSDVGVWPAFWMLPANGSWPPEIDVFEAYGGTNPLYQTVHTGIYGGDHYQQVITNQPSMTSGYHTYGVMWGPQYITFYFDGNATGQLPTPADMHQPMYLVADLAMQALSGVTSDPKHFSIDYIRAYSNDPNAAAVPLGTVSSPDGADTSGLYGATHSVHSHRKPSRLMPPPRRFTRVKTTLCPMLWSLGCSTDLQYSNSPMASRSASWILKSMPIRPLARRLLRRPHISKAPLARQTRATRIPLRAMRHSPLTPMRTSSAIPAAQLKSSSL